MKFCATSNRYEGLNQVILRLERIPESDTPYRCFSKAYAPFEGGIAAPTAVR